MVYRETGASHRGDPRITAQGHEWDSAQWQSSCQGMGTVYMGVGGSLKEVRGRGGQNTNPTETWWMRSPVLMAGGWGGRCDGKREGQDHAEALGPSRTSG